MHLCNCEKPTYQFNRYLDRDVRVSCGKCPACLNAKAKNWITRLETEAQYHKYAFMVNLTYDDAHLPVLGFSDDMESLEYVNRDSECIPLHELLSYDNESRDLEYLSDRLRDPLGLPVVFAPDVQKFLKRLNKYIYEHYTNSYGNFRYFFCFEYGPTTFRTHAHGIIYHSIDRLADEFQEVVSKNWALGDSPTSCIYGPGGFSYVAQYVNLLTHLPAFYSHPKFHQSPIFSKFPSIGTRTLLDSEIRDIYDRKPIRRSLWNPSAGRYVNLPVSSAFKDRFFPKCPQYNTRSFADRVALYRCTEVLPSFDFEEFRSSCDKLAWLASRSLCNHSEGVIHCYVADLRKNAKSPESFRSSLYRLFLVSKRVKYISLLLRSSVENVVKHIDEFYKKIDYDRLTEFYEWQSVYSKMHPPSELMFAYPEFVRDYQFYEKYPKVPCSDSFLAGLDSFGIDTLNPPVFSRTYDFMTICNTSYKIYKDTHKNHEKNAYLYSRKFGALNPTLQTIMIKYHNNA